MTSENSPFEEYREPTIIRRPAKRDSDYQAVTSDDEFLEDLPPIEERFRLETVDAIAEGLLVHAPLDRVCELLAQLGTRWERDVYSQTIHGCGLLVFQFRGHAWTGILDGYEAAKYGVMLAGYVPDDWNWESQVQSLSQQLDNRTIHYWVDDHADGLGYTYWENGRLMERMKAEGDYSEIEEEEADELETDEDYDDDEEDLDEGSLKPYLFESQLRTLTAAEIENAYYLITDFLYEQKAFAAIRLYTSDFQHDDFVRVDYIAFA